MYFQCDENPITKLRYLKFLKPTVKSRQSSRFFSSSTTGTGRPLLIGIVATIRMFDVASADDENNSRTAVVNDRLRSSIFPKHD